MHIFFFGCSHIKILTHLGLVTHLSASFKFLNRFRRAATLPQTTGASGSINTSASAVLCMNLVSPAKRVNGLLDQVKVV
mgnify:CR=1 FL=1